MNISKMTINYAARRGLVLELIEADEYVETPRLWFYTDADNCCEPDFSYLVNDNGSFSFYDNLYLPRAVKEELPATIFNERQLRQVIDFVARELAA